MSHVPEQLSGETAAHCHHGRIELAAPDGNTADGVVPTCVLAHQLIHAVALKSACKFDVKLEERNITAP